MTVATGYFVAQEFGYVAVDRGKLKQRAAEGDQASARALEVTGRLSFMLSGAQLGITVTALLVGYAAEPYLGAGLAELLGLAGVSTGVSLPLSVALALVIATVVQMVVGELAPKNLAIARPEPVARALSRSTLVYLAIAGPLIKLFDKSAVRLLRRVGIEPIEELPSGATPEDLEQIIAESRLEGHLDADMSTLLDRGLDFRQLTAGEAMVPRVDVHTVRAHEPVSRVVELLDTGRSRFPVRGTEGVDDLVGVIGIADVLQVPPAERATTPVSAVAVPRCWCPRRCRCPPCWTGSARGTASSPAWWTSTAASRASSPSRTSPRNWSARSATRTTRRSGPRAAGRRLLGGARPLAYRRGRRQHRHRPARGPGVRHHLRAGHAGTGPGAGGR
ncbi:hypothetical protein GCM10029963_29050 [Micromonospora andamanensis]